LDEDQGGSVNDQPNAIDAQPRGRARVMLYATLLVAVLVVNSAIFVWGAAAGWWQPHAHSLQIIAAISQLNLLFAILPRQHWAVNLISWLATRAPTSWPLRLRWRLAQYYHVGGLHVGGAMAGTAWYIVYFVLLAPAWADGEPGYDDVSVLLALLITLVLLTTCVLAAPRIRSRHHDLFEASHRFGTWSVLVLAWINALVLAQLQTPLRRFGEALLTSPIFWMLVVSTALALWPWLLLRRVAVTVERPSDHAAIVRLDYGYTPPVGTTRAISRHPLFGWHPFACVPAAPGESGYRMVVSRAGEWTSRFIDEPPTHVWVRGIPTVGVANAKRLFRRVLYVTTGAGARASAHRHAGLQAGVGHQDPACHLRRRPRRRGDRGATRGRDLEHARAGQARRGRARLRGIPRLRSRRGHLRREPAGHLPSRPRVRAPRHPGFRSDLGLVRDRAASRRPSASSGSARRTNMEG
jgi:hypothetical protein